MVGFVWLDERHGRCVAQLSDDDLALLEQELLSLRLNTAFSWTLAQTRDLPLTTHSYLPKQSRLNH